VAFVNLVFAVFFFALRAPIVPPFLGLDVLALTFALSASFRSGQALERVRVSADEITVLRERGGRAWSIWSSPTAFTRVDVLEPGRHAVCVRLACRGEEIALGAALGPVQREAFGRELEAAVRSARSERWTG
jgi:uncharacterized membrane protein